MLNQNEAKHFLNKTINVSYTEDRVVGSPFPQPYFLRVVDCPDVSLVADGDHAHGLCVDRGPLAARGRLAADPDAGHDHVGTVHAPNAVPAHGELPEAALEGKTKRILYFV